MHIHFIAIGGAAMHNLAIALKRKGLKITGSDDQIFEPSLGRLAAEGILPDAFGWHPERLSPQPDAIVLGMHARKDNPELLKAKELDIPVYSYPEYLYKQCENKKRVVIGGSHGKTTITSMLLHVMNVCKLECDYMVGALLEGFDCMVKLTEHNDLAVFEGDEYLSSPIDLRPKFHLYRPHLALISGIAWDHINVFPTFENYKFQFEEFANLIEPEGVLVWCKSDLELEEIVKRVRKDIKLVPYETHPHVIEAGQTFLIENGEKIPIHVFGRHNLQNISAAKALAFELGISSQDFNMAISSFKGASRRLELICESPNAIIYKDFAHSPSKLKATTSAFKNQFPNRKLIACMELHTFSSLNDSFLNEYHLAMDAADVAIVYYDPQTVKNKKLEAITPERIKSAFGGKEIVVLTDPNAIKELLTHEVWENQNLLWMSSGNFGGIAVEEFSRGLLTG